MSCIWRSDQTTSSDHCKLTFGGRICMLLESGEEGSNKEQEAECIPNTARQIRISKVDTDVLTRALSPESKALQTVFSPTQVPVSWIFLHCDLIFQFASLQ
ncbi:unnamed protein product [Urochloa humidicola]